MKRINLFFLSLLACLLVGTNAWGWTKPDPSKTYLLRNAYGSVNTSTNYNRYLTVANANATSISGQKDLPNGKIGLWKFEPASSNDHEYYLKNVLTGKYLYVANPSAGASLGLHATNKSVMYLDAASSPVSGTTDPTLISFGSTKAFAVHGDGPKVWSGQGGGNQWLIQETGVPETGKLYKIKGYNDYYMLGTGSAGTGRQIPTATSATDETTLWWYYSPEKYLIGYTNKLAVYQTYGLTASYSETVAFEIQSSTLTKVSMKTNFSSGGKYIYNHGANNNNINRNGSYAANYCDYTVEEVPSSKYYRIVFDNTPDGTTITYNSVTHDSKMPFFATSEGGTIEKGDLSASIPGKAPVIDVNPTNRIITLSCLTLKNIVFIQRFSG